MSATILNNGSPTHTFDVTAGADGIISSSGTLDDCYLSLEYAQAGTPSVFAAVNGGQFDSHFQRAIRFPGSKLKVTLTRKVGTGTITSAVNVDVT